MEIVTIKLLDNPDNPDLKMKYIGAADYATPKTSRDGKVITGVDENSIEILSIEDKKTRDEASKQMLKKRESLEKLLGVDLKPGSEFWRTFNITLTDEEISLDLSNPLDQLKEAFLLANHWVAPSEESIDTDERYANCIFYMHREAEDASRKARVEQEKDKAIVKLFSLNDKNPELLKTLTAYIFGYNENIEFTLGQCYMRLKSFINDKDEKVQKKNIQTFLGAAEKSPSELTIKLIFDRAAKKKIIVGRKGVYRYGDSVLGATYEEALANLGQPEFSADLITIKKEVGL